MDVHDDRLHIRRFVDRRALAHGAVHRRLHLTIDRQPDGIARPGGNVLGDAVGQRLCPRIHFRHDAPRLAGEHVVIAKLQTALPHAVHVAKAEHLRKALAHRIPPADVFVKCKPLKRSAVGMIFIRHNRAKTIHILAQDLSFERHRGGIHAAKLFKKRRFIQRKLPCQHARQPLCIRHVAHSRAGDEAGDGLSNGFSVCILNIAALCRDDAAAGPLLCASGGQLIRSEHLQHKQPRSHAKKKEKEYAHQRSRPLSYGGRR